MRHGGCRNVYNQTNGDLEIAGQLLGNYDAETIRTYAKRDKLALKRVAESQWQRYAADIEADRI